MNRMRRRIILIVLFGFPCLIQAENSDLQQHLGAIRKVGLNGQGNKQAADAWNSLAQADAEQIPQILAGMKGANLLAVNWIRAAIETIRDRQIKSGAPLPVAELEKFLADTQQDPRARRLAYELIAKVDNGAESRLIPRLVDDPSLELRRDAVALLLDEAKGIDPKQPAQVAVDAYLRVLPHARDLDQLKEIETRLKELEATADFATHYGFVMAWHVIGPFEHAGNSAFDVAYAPEREINLSAEYDGKSSRVKWIRHETKDPHGNVDLNELLGVHKGAIAYAFAEFQSDRERDVELRLGSMNANKAWLNGKLLTANNVYHTGVFIDQYVGKGTLKKGKNTILLKIAQNEQTEDWAKHWKFQLRVCDEIGTAVLSADRSRTDGSVSGG